MYPHRVHGDLKHASAVMDRGFSFGNHQHIDDAARAHIADSIDSFMRAN
jgi:dTDP-4-amino-4,6-dideoxygalactose transaminase